MSTNNNSMPAYAVSLSTCTYAVYCRRDGLSSGRDIMPGGRYKVSACFDQMSAYKDQMLTDTYYVSAC